MDEIASCAPRHPRVGALVQQAMTLGADRKCLPRRVRDELLSVAGRLARDGETQLKQSPENPGRFTGDRETLDGTKVKKRHAGKLARIQG